MTSTLTVLVARHADAEAVRRTIARRHGTPAVVTARDVTASFPSASDAADAALDVVRSAPQARVALSCGDATGGLPEQAHLTARAALDHAGAGQVVVDDIVRLLLAPRDAYVLTPIDAALFVLEARDGRTPALSVIVADDATLVRNGVVRLLADNGFVVVAEAADATELVRLTDEHRPDLVITDIRMPPTNTEDGLRAAAELRDRHPTLAVLVLSQHIESRIAAELLDDDAKAGIGYLLKERVVEIEEFLATCRAVAAGERVVDPIIAAELMAPRDGDDPIDRLTDRERDVLALMAEGQSNAAIAAALHLSPKTLETHVRAIFLKLQLAENADENRRVAAVLHWLKHRPSRR